MKHKHHIIPRYMGGSDSKENLVEVTITQHAMFHFCNWQLWNDKRDWLAWKGLIGSIGKEKISIELSRKNIVYAHERNKFLWENDHDWVNKRCEVLRKIQMKATEIAQLPENRQKQIESFAKIKHAQGEKNSQYGKMWITNGTKEGSFRINKNDPIPEGYRKGRVCS